MARIIALLMISCTVMLLVIGASTGNKASVIFGTQLPESTGVPAVNVSGLERIEDLCCPTQFAPDGNTYLTIRDGSLWLHSLSGTRAEKVLDNVLTAAWTPDGRSIVFTRQSDGPVANVGLLDLSSGQTKMIGGTSIPWRFVFDPSNRLVLAMANRFQLVDPVSGESAELPLIESRGADPLNFTELAFSSDGRHVAVLEGVKLSIVDLRSQTKVVVTDQIDRRRWAPFGWSSDGSQLAYSIVPERMAPPELWVVNADGTGADRILTQPEGRVGVLAGITWLPGTRYIVHQFIPHSNVATLHAEYQVVNADGGPSKTLFTNGLGLRLSPDGHTISFVRDLPGAEETGNWIAVLSY